MGSTNTIIIVVFSLWFQSQRRRDSSHWHLDFGSWRPSSSRGDCTPKQTTVWLITWYMSWASVCRQICGSPCEITWYKPHLPDHIISFWPTFLTKAFFVCKSYRSVLLGLWVKGWFSDQEAKESTSLTNVSQCLPNKNVACFSEVAAVYGCNASKQIERAFVNRSMTHSNCKC